MDEIRIKDVMFMVSRALLQIDWQSSNMEASCANLS